MGASLVVICEVGSISEQKNRNTLGPSDAFWRRLGC